MGFRTGSYATIWTVESASDTRNKSKNFYQQERISRQENMTQIFPGLWISLELLQLEKLCL